MTNEIHRRNLIVQSCCVCGTVFLSPAMSFAKDNEQFLCSTVIEPLDEVELQAVGEQNNQLVTDENDDDLTLQGTIRKRSIWRASDGLSPNSGQIELGVGFIGNPDNGWKSQIKERAMRWLPDDRIISQRIRFNFEVPIHQCQIRIAQTGINGIPKRNNSAVGRDALHTQYNSKQTMNIYNLSSVEHEFGHALGLVHEHTNPEVPITINKDKAIEYYYQNYGWMAETTEYNLLSVGERCVGDPNFNATSIMAYTVPAEITNEGVGLFPSGEITYRDRNCLDALYG